MTVMGFFPQIFAICLFYLMVGVARRMIKWEYGTDLLDSIIRVFKKLGRSFNSNLPSRFQKKLPAFKHIVRCNQLGIQRCMSIINFIQKLMQP